MKYQIFPQTRLTSLLGIEKPIIQAGMVYVSGGKLAAAAANSGCLGVIGAGSMQPDILASQISKAKALTDRPLGVNIPLLYSKVDEQIQVALNAGIRIFITSAGSPKKFTSHLKDSGCTVIHVASSPHLAIKCQEAGVDAVILEGFEAGGHNGRDELTTLVLLQQAQNALSIPIIAAGGIGSGSAIAAAFALGAEGVQIGTLFAAAQESSAHPNFKESMVRATYESTLLSLKKLVPVRLLNNAFATRIRELESRGATQDELQQALGKGRARLGMLEGDIDEGELEIGQIVSQIHSIEPLSEIIRRLETQYGETLNKLLSLTNPK